MATIHSRCVGCKRLMLMEREVKAKPAPAVAGMDICMKWRRLLCRKRMRGICDTNNVTDCSLPTAATSSACAAWASYRRKPALQQSDTGDKPLRCGNVYVYLLQGIG